MLMKTVKKCTHNVTNMFSGWFVFMIRKIPRQMQKKNGYLTQNGSSVALLYGLCFKQFSPIHIEKTYGPYSPLFSLYFNKKQNQSTDVGSKFPICVSKKILLAALAMLDSRKHKHCEAKRHLFHLFFANSPIKPYVLLYNDMFKR